MRRADLHLVPPSSASLDASAKAAERQPIDASAFLALAQGDMSALGAIYDRHAAAMLAFAMRVAPGDADDLVQDAFLVATRRAAHYDGRHASARGWLIGIVARLAAERRRGFVRRARAMFGLEQAVAGPSPQLVASGGDLEKGLQRLTAAKRVVLLLAEVEGYSCEEIAVQLGVPIGTVWTRLHHARRELREFYGELP